ncbi:unnamed protein product [Rotaria sp. Silwood2]|nr:unnamed protein product [Rotaria sp. Silwood2]CAF4279253.1 unnamed protein product [Rotaria sp. Silwood2]
MIQATVFPVGLILIIMTSVELFTGNTMILMISTLDRKTTLLNLIISWIVLYCGNFAGCLFCSGILVYYVGILSNDPYLSFTVQLAAVKGNIEWHQIFLRGIAGDWLICLGISLTISTRELHSKIIAIYLPIWFLISVGYEHSIANMFTVQMVTLGNIVGGTFFVGFLYWYLYMPKKTDTETNDNDKSSADDC